MSNANFEFNMNQTNPWSKMSAGAKVATVVAGLGIAAASVAASVFLAGAALFAGIVLVTYQWVSGRSLEPEPEGSVVDAEFSEVDKYASSN